MTATTPNRRRWFETFQECELGPFRRNSLREMDDVGLRRVGYGRGWNVTSVTEMAKE